MAEQQPARYEITFQDDSTETVYGVVEWSADGDLEIREYLGNQATGEIKSYKKAGIRDWGRKK